MAIWLKKCASIGEAANGYMVELQVITDDICQWLNKFEEEAAAYLSSSTSQVSKELLPPKTPAREKRLRKRLLKATNQDDAENSPPPYKSSRSTSLSQENAIKKLSICLTRIEENNSNKIISPQKAPTPAKPPRRLKLEFESSQGIRSAPEVIEAEGSLIVALKERLSNHTNVKGITSTTPHMSTSRRRSSIARVKARHSIRRSKRLSEKDRRATVTITETDDDDDTSVIAEETVEPAKETVEPAEDRITPNLRHSSRIASAAKCTEYMSVKKDVVMETERRSNSSAVIPAAKNEQEASRNRLNTTTTIFKENVIDNVSADSIDDDCPKNDTESDVDSVISKTPSPVCPRNKVVRSTKMRKPQPSAVHTSQKTPVSKTSMSAGLSGRNKLQGKANISGWKTKAKARNSSLSSNANYSIARLSPKPMTPQQKQDKVLEMIYLREQKSKEILRQCKETLKKTIEEKKKKRAEKLMKAKMQKEKLEEARLAKIREEEERIIQRQKMQEEAEKKRIALEKQAEKELEMQRQAERRQRELEEREKLQREAEQNKILKEKAEKTQNQLNSTVTIEKKLNSTVVLDKSHNESNNYNMTPQPVYPLPNRNADNYDIDNLDEGDSTDDDEQPRQVIPRWAEGHDFKKAILQQLRSKINYEDIFPSDDLMPVPDLTKIFHGTRKKKYDKRTSSAVWSSPLWKAT